MPRKIRITPEFLAEVADAEIDHPGARDTILLFLDNRRKNPVWQGFGAKDARLKGLLDDTWHVHIVHGTVLLYYGISEASLDAYCLGDHTHVETTPKQKAFRKTIKAYRAGQFLPFDVDAALRPPPMQPLRMERDKLSVFEDIIYELLSNADDRGVVEVAANGSYDGLRDYVSILAGHEVEPPGFWDAVVSGFGGDAAFRKWLESAVARVPGEVTS